MKTNTYCTDALVVLWSLGSFLTLLAASAAPKEEPVDQVNPFIGTGGHGHTFPGASLPFGMVQLSPDTRLTGWDGCSGYHFSDAVIYGFSHTHLSGTGCSDYGDILLLPAAGPVKLTTGYRASGENRPTFDASGYGSRFSKGSEVASPGYYAVTLDDYGVKAELTATPRAGFHRYTFSRTEKAHILLDLQHRDEVLESSLKIVDARTVEGFRRSRAWARNQPVYFVARFSKPFEAAVASDDRLSESVREGQGKNIKAVLHFKLQPGEQVLVKVGISAVDLKGARQNLDTEIPAWDFDRTRREARAAWVRALHKIEIAGGTRDQRTIFYTALYHTCLQPNLFTDVDHRYLGRDMKIHTAEGYAQHTVFSLWDTFRAAHPLYTIIDQKRSHDFIRTFLSQAEQGGLLPVWELWGNETGCMIANHAIPVIVDAYLKGIRDFDAEEAFAAMKKSAMQDDLGLSEYKRTGYITSDQTAQSVSRTLEYAYDDWCIAQMAKALGKQADYELFLRRSQAYQHLLDPETGLMRPKLDNRWKTPFDPAEVDFNYTEANAWQYSFFVPHDVAGHMARLGGPEAYAAKLDAMFSAPSQTSGREQSDISGLVGQYAHGNEPSHHMAYLYAFAGKPWKTQAMVRRLLNGMYANNPDGLIGNEDCGQMSAWYVLSAMGFYAANPCGGEYVIGSPIFDRVEFNLENGRHFLVTAQGAVQGPYIQHATLNGQPYDRSYLRYEDIMKGGKLAFIMGDKPNTSWGSAQGSRPHSAVRECLVQPVPFVASGEPHFQERTSVALSSPLATARIHYTLDGTTPTSASPRFDRAFELGADTTVKFFAEAAGYAPTPVLEASFRRSTDPRGITLRTKYNPQYTAGGDRGLVDGIRGANDFHLPAWQGYGQVDLDAVVDLRSEQDLHRVALGCLQDPTFWIFMPTRVSFEISLDGQTFKPVGSVENNVDPHAEGSITHDFTLTLPPGTRARFVHVLATNLGKCPDWHRGAGQSCFLFADEIVTE